MDMIADIFEKSYLLFLNDDIICIARFALFVAVSIPCIITDITKKEVPSMILISLAVLILTADFVIGITVFIHAALGSVLISVIFLSIYFISKRGIGPGDMFYLICYSSLFGAAMTVTAFLFSFWIGAAVLVIPLLLKKIGRKTRIPFVPFLFAGGVSSSILTLIIHILN